jgi:excisionase family DNA binding protein
MSEVTTADFPFVQDLPKREKSKLLTVWEEFRELCKLAEGKGTLIPVVLTANVLNMSTQRVYQLIESGKLEAIRSGRTVLVTEASVVELARTERKTGRPFKHPETIGQMWKAATDSARGVTPKDSSK